MNKLFFGFVLLACTWFGSAYAETNQCDEVIAYFNEFSNDSLRENLKLEVLPEVLSDSTEGSEGALYRDDNEVIRLIDLIHYGETGKQIVSYTIFDEQNYRVDISRVYYDKPINTEKSPTIINQLNKRIDICNGVEVDVYADKPESSDLKNYPLIELLQTLSDE